MSNVYSKATWLRRCAPVLLALAGIAAAIPAFADPLYEADRAYCMRGEATEARSLCLKEAAAALADRQGKAHASGKRHTTHQAGSETKVQSADKPASTP
jgi:hypothetical protein